MKHIVITILCFWVIIGQAQNNKLNLNNLNQNTNVRTLGMANTTVATQDGIESANYNPAAIGFLNHPEAVWTYNGLSNQFNYSFLGYAEKQDSAWSIGFSAFYFSWPDSSQNWSIPHTTNSLNDHVYDIDFMITSAYQLNQFTSIGIALKNILRKLPGQNRYAYFLALSAGLLYHKDRYSVGLSIRNIKATNSRENQKPELPVLLSAGIAYKLNRMISFSAEIETYSEGKRLNLTQKTGLEFKPLSFFAIRTGLNLTKKPGRTKQIINSFGGAGLNFWRLSLDYAYNPYQEYGDTHFLGLIYSFPVRKTSQINSEKLYNGEKNAGIIDELPQQAESTNKTKRPTQTEPEYPSVLSPKSEITELSFLTNLARKLALKNDSLDLAVSQTKKAKIMAQMAELQQTLAAHLSTTQYKFIMLTVGHESSLYEVLSRVHDFQNGDAWKRIYSAWNGELVTLDELHPGQKIFILYKNLKTER